MAQAQIEQKRALHALDTSMKEIVSKKTKKKKNKKTPMVKKALQMATQRTKMKQLKALQKNKHLLPKWGKHNAAFLNEEWLKKNGPSSACGDLMPSAITQSILPMIIATAAATTEKQTVPKTSPPPPHPEEIQSMDAIRDLSFARGKASTKQCYWCLVIDAFIMALVQYCQETCEGCKTYNHKNHNLCDLPVKTVWARNRTAVLARVNISMLMGKWSSAVYMNCGIGPREVETLFALCDPRTMIIRWQEDLQCYTNPNTVVDLEGVPWRKEANTHMAKISYPASWCSFDVGLPTFLQKTSSSF